jgi:hypothetical protein
VTNVTTNFIARLTNGVVAGLGSGALNPLWERGELSELSVLNSSAASSVAAGTVISNAFDRGREELVRRSIEMITTRGSVFTVYVVGEGMQVTVDGTGTSARTNTNYLGQVRLKQTFEVAPGGVTWTNGTVATNDVFDVNNIVDRFRSVTNFTTRVISTIYD